MATLGELQSRISARLLDTSNNAVTAAQITTQLNESIRSWKLKRFWFNETSSNVSLTADNSILTPPSDFLIEIPKNGFTINYGNVKWPLNKVSPLTYDDMDVQAKGLPEIYKLVGGVYSVYFIPDQAYTVICKYLKDYDDLADNDDTNDFTVNADSLIMYDSLAKLHGELRQDEKMESYYVARAENEYKILRDYTNKQTASGKLAVDSIL